MPSWLAFPITNETQEGPEVRCDNLWGRVKITEARNLSPLFSYPEEHMGQTQCVQGSRGRDSRWARTAAVPLPPFQSILFKGALTDSIPIWQALCTW